MPYLFVFDIDGTLIPNSANTLDSDAIQSLQIAKSLGKVILASARPIFGIQNILPSQLLSDFDLVGYNGALIKKDGETISLSHISQNVASSILKKYSSIEDIWVFRNDVWYSSNLESSFYKKEAFAVKSYAKPLDFLDNFDFINKITILSEDVNELIEAIKNDFGSFVMVTKSNDCYIEIVPFGIDKFSVVKDFFLKSNDFLIAFGDSENDKTLLENADFSYTVANATENIRNIAKFTSAKKYSEGVLDSINKFINEKFTQKIK